MDGTASGRDEMKGIPAKHRPGSSYDGRERRWNADYVTQDVFDDFRKQIHVALFAPDSDNGNGQPGLMVTARNIDKHITVICNIGRWGLRLFAGALAIGAPLAVMGKNVGWW